MNDAAHAFRRRWWVANSVGFAVGLVLFSLLGHGITGAHDDELTAAQYIAHTVAFLAGSLVVLGAQSRNRVRKYGFSRLLEVIGLEYVQHSLWSLHGTPR